MSARFEELDRRQTPMGELTLRRREEPTLRVEVHEVKLDDEFLMSSLFTAAEIELARLALTKLEDFGADSIEVIVGGLGLGYTAHAVLEDPRVRSMRVVEALPEVIEWHERGLLPLAASLTGDPRCELINDDFFAIVARGASFGPGTSSRSHAVLVDIDHSPRHVLHPSHAAFYEREGLQRLADRLHPGGVFGLWADGQPDDEFVAVASDVFASCEARVVSFPNFYTGGESASTVYLATT